MTTAEHDMLIGYLRGQRRHLLSAVDGLDDTALRSATLPSGWTPLGLLSHLTHDVELFWFAGAVAADPAQIARIEADGNDAWHPDPDLTAAQIRDAYEAAAARTDEIALATALDAPPAWWPEAIFGADWRLANLREVLLHTIVETAAHAGQMDAARELVDGRQWVVLT